MSLAVDDFQQPCNFNILSEKLGLFATAAVAPPALKLCKPYKEESYPILSRHCLKISRHRVYDNLDPQSL